ncbi:MAG: hypothetical protein KGJ02_05815 [Verrucomicrobiota bacterium]|nr:hypothetical protein [Verrucomicrobiota bacterium]
MTSQAVSQAPAKILEYYGISSHLNLSPSERPYWMYCCGAFATPDSAREQAATLLGKKGRGVIVHHLTLLNYLDRTPEEFQRQAKIADFIAEKIKPIITNLSWGPGICVEKPRNPLTVVAHSFGAELCYQALYRLSEDEREALTVVTYGGVRMIPNSLAKKVINYVSYHDLIAADSNPVFDSENVLARVKKVYKEMTFKNESSLRGAIAKVFAQQMHDHFSSAKVKPSNDEEAVKQEKTNIFQNVFIFGKGDVLSQERIASGLKSWVELFQKYTICFVPADSNEKIEPALFSEKDGATLAVDDDLCNQARQNMVGLGQRSLKSHEIDHLAKHQMDIPVSYQTRN